MNIFGAIIQKFLYVLVRILPKANVAVLRGFPDFDDNLIAIYYGLESRPVARVIWVVDDPNVTPAIQLRSNTKVVQRGGPFDYFYSMIARYLFLTHGHFLRKTPSNQTSVNLWHGIPFKKIGKAMGLAGRLDTHLIATSEFTEEVFADAFGMPKDRILVAGQARTDRMLTVDKAQIWQQLFPDKPTPKKVILWLPTYRQTALLGGRSDGEFFDNIFNCSDFSEERFNDILKLHDTICLVKPHPMAVSSARQDHDSLIFINESWLQDRRTSLYQLLGAADCLVSDISSVIADFMLLDRPIVLLFEDIDTYESNRGFSFNPITNYLPADVSRNFTEFLNEIKPVLTGADPYALRRAELKKLFFAHAESGAVERILDEVMEPNSVGHNRNA